MWLNQRFIPMLQYKVGQTQLATHNCSRWGWFWFSLCHSLTHSFESKVTSKPSLSKFRFIIWFCFQVLMCTNQFSGHSSHKKNIITATALTHTCCYDLQFTFTSWCGVIYVSKLACAVNWDIWRVSKQWKPLQAWQLAERYIYKDWAIMCICWRVKSHTCHFKYSF